MSVNILFQGKRLSVEYLWHRYRNEKLESSKSHKMAISKQGKNKDDAENRQHIHSPFFQQTKNTFRRARQNYHLLGIGIFVSLHAHINFEPITGALQLRRYVLGAEQMKLCLTQFETLFSGVPPKTIRSESTAILVTPVINRTLPAISLSKST